MVYGLVKECVPSPIIAGKYEDCPEAGNAGRLFICEDRPFKLYDDGTSWTRYNEYGKMFDVPAQGWEWSYNKEDSVCSENEGSLNVVCRSSYTPHPVFLYREIPITPYKVTFQWESSLIADEFAPENRTGAIYFGFGSNCGKAMTLGLRDFGIKPNAFVARWQDQVHFKGFEMKTKQMSMSAAKFVQLEDDDNYRKISISPDGVNFTTLVETGNHYKFIADKIVIGVFNQNLMLEVKSIKYD
jgi:hypothetical protein